MTFEDEVIEIARSNMNLVPEMEKLLRTVYRAGYNECLRNIKEKRNNCQLGLGEYKYMTDRDLMQQALEALESVTGHFTRTPSTLRDSEVRGEAHKAITALRERLTQPEQEHMSERIRELAEQCVGDRPYNNSFDYEKFAELIIQECIGKKEWVGLTDEEISAVDWKPNETLHDYARHIELKLRGKNT